MDDNSDQRPENDGHKTNKRTTELEANSFADSISLDTTEGAPNPDLNLCLVEPAFPHALDFKAIRAATMIPALDFKAMQAATMIPALDFKAMRAAIMGPAIDFKAMRAAVMSPAIDFKAMRAAVMGPALDFKAMQAAVMGAAIDFKAMQAATLVPALDFKAMQAAVMGPALDFRAIQTLMKSFPAILSLGASLAAISSLPESQNFDWHALPTQTVLETISVAREDEHNALTSLISHLTLAEGSSLTAQDIGATQAAIEAELSSISKAGDTSNLSSVTKWFITWLIWLTSASFGYLALQNGAREELCFLQPKILPGMTAGQLGKTIRSAACEIPLDLLKNYRFVRGESVRLRANPGMKAEVLEVFLSDGALLEVLENDNRVWLRVSVVGQDGVEGWISKKYVRRLVD